MKSFPRLFVAFSVALSCACAAFAQSADRASVMPDRNIPPLGQGVLKDQSDRVRATKRLPVYGLSIVETVDGMVFLISDNGRFAVIGGRWVDLFAGKTITGIADSGSLDKLDLPRMGIDVDEFAPFVVGSGPARVTVFIDPADPVSLSALRQMSSLGSRFTFQAVLLPLNGPESGRAARRIHCAPDRRIALVAMTNGALASLPDPSPDCDVSPVQKAFIAANVLNIRRTPYFVMPDATTLSMPSADVALADVLSGKAPR